jgi:lipopolysaccharide transport system ATP-binding protein
MSDSTIRVENLSKKYIIGHQKQERYTTLRDSISNGSKSLMKTFTGQSTKEATSEEFWALTGVSFEVKQGERIGIIGRNGAGKSTLLKILSRITEPTTGSIRINGRVASLLEVGTGFHPELTGRENIFLNGAILGMEKTEIQRKFDEIVDFAEIEKFLDTPVKRYSSGMYVRLAFAVAAHLEPEILIVDEVLAVGDAQFQKKCLGKMEDVTNKEGRTILFVSHNMSTIQSLCSRCILLKQGQIITDDQSSLVIQSYLQDHSASDNFARPPQKNGKPTIVSGEIISNPHLEHTKLQINLGILSEATCKAAVSLKLLDATLVPIGYGSIGEFRPNQVIDFDRGLNAISFTLSIDRLALGAYFISLDLSVPAVEFYDRVENCLSFEVARPPKDDAIQVLSQSWGAGCMELAMDLI